MSVDMRNTVIRQWQQRCFLNIQQIKSQSKSLKSSQSHCNLPPLAYPLTEISCLPILESKGMGAAEEPHVLP